MSLRRSYAIDLKSSGYSQSTFLLAPASVRLPCSSLARPIQKALRQQDRERPCRVAILGETYSAGIGNTGLHLMQNQTTGLFCPLPSALTGSGSSGSSLSYHHPAENLNLDMPRTELWILRTQGVHSNIEHQAHSL